MPPRSTAPNPNPSGICWCGCGKPAAIATKSDSKSGAVRGCPTRYVRGHNAYTRVPGLGRAAPVRTAVIDTSVTKPLGKFSTMPEHGAGFLGVCNGRDVYACAACDSPMQARPDRKRGDTYRVPRGIRRHNGLGLCELCAKARRRAVAEVAEPKPEPRPEPEDSAAGEVLALLVAGMDWAADGACSGLGRTGGYEPFDMPDGHDHRDGIPPEAVRAARRYCARCPVLDECHDFAERLDSPSVPLTGLWAGQWRTNTTVTPITTKATPELAEPVPA